MRDLKLSEIVVGVKQSEIVAGVKLSKIVVGCEIECSVEKCANVLPQVLLKFKPMRRRSQYNAEMAPRVEDNL